MTRKISGGKRGHSRYAPHYLEVCKLHSQGMTWEEIAAKLLETTTLGTVDRSALFRMWQNRQKGAVFVGSMPKVAWGSSAEITGERGSIAETHLVAEDGWGGQPIIAKRITPEQQVGKKPNSLWDSVTTEGISN